MYIVDVIGGRVLLLLRSVCVAKAAVGVAGQCLVRPELTFEYLTTGTSGRLPEPVLYQTRPSESLGGRSC